MSSECSQYMVLLFKAMVTINHLSINQCVFSQTSKSQLLLLLGPLLWSNLDAKVREQQSVDDVKKLIRKQNLAALISTNDCENCVLCNS